MPDYSIELEKYIKKLERQAIRLQEELYNELIDKIFSIIEVDKTVKLSEKNYYALEKINNIVDEFTLKYETPVLLDIADKMLKSIEQAVLYYEKYDFSQKQLAAAAKKAGIIEARIGIKAGKVVKGGWLDTLAQNTEIKERLRSYVSDAITNQSSLGQFTQGMKNLVKGTSDSTGLVEKRYKQYIHDSLFQSDAFVKKEMALDLGLKYFVYAGGLIKTSRDFCIARDSKTFSIEEAEQWRELSWQGKSEPYEPLVDRGGYNCRHYLQFISDEQAAANRTED